MFKKKKEEEEEEEREKEERCGTYIAYYQQKYYHAAMITFDAHFPLGYLLLHCSFINPHLDFHLILFSCFPFKLHQKNANDLSSNTN
jgi:hypothetical protein